jgi:hypothetical protein
MAENKTKATDASVDAFLAAVEPERRRIDGRVVLEMMARISGEPPKMWGPSIIGFGSCHYRYESGREGDMPRIGFSPRKAQLVLYLADGFAGRDALFARLGKHSTSKACLYINKLADVDLAVLEQLMVASSEYMRKTYPS